MKGSQCSHLVHIGDDGGALDVHEDEARDDVGLQGRVGPGGAAGIDVETALVLVSFKLNDKQRNQSEPSEPS